MHAIHIFKCSFGYAYFIHFSQKQFFKVRINGEEKLVNFIFYYKMKLVKVFLVLLQKVNFKLPFTESGNHLLLGLWTYYPLLPGIEEMKTQSVIYGKLAFFLIGCPVWLQNFTPPSWEWTQKWMRVPSAQLFVSRTSTVGWILLKLFLFCRR